VDKNPEAPLSAGIRVALIPPVWFLRSCRSFAKRLKVVPPAVGTLATVLLDDEDDVEGDPPN